MARTPNAKSGDADEPLPATGSERSRASREGANADAVTEQPTRADERKEQHGGRRSNLATKGDVFGDSGWSFVE